MTFHLYDDDPRALKDADYPINHGSFACITRNINRELNDAGLFSRSPHDASVVGFASGLKLNFGFTEKQRFIIGVWECNQIPEILIRTRAALEAGGRYRYFGLSEQVKEIWQAYGFPTPIVDIGVDTDFWRPIPVQKFDKFTILSVTSCNFRSGILELMEAVRIAHEMGVDCRLIIKNTDERARLEEPIKKLEKSGIEVIYDLNRCSSLQLRELIAKSHLVSYAVINTSAGLPILEAGAMGIPVLVGDLRPTNLYPHCLKVSTSQVSIAELKPKICPYLPYTFPEGWIDESKAIMHVPDIVEYAEKINFCYKNQPEFITKSEETRQEIVKNWTWKRATNQLLNLYAQN